MVIMRRVSELKQRSFAQRVGTAGENQFRLMADRQHLTVAIKVEEDFGVDFMCQAEQTSGTKSVNPMIPATSGSVSAPPAWQTDVSGSIVRTRPTCCGTGNH